MEDSGTAGGAPTGSASGAGFDDLRGRTAPWPGAAYDWAASLSALAAGAISLAMSSVSVGNVTFGEAAAPFRRTDPAADPSLAIRLARAVEAPALVPSGIGSGSPAEIVPTTPQAGGAPVDGPSPLALPRLHQCHPSEALFAAGGVSCPDMARGIEPAAAPAPPPAIEPSALRLAASAPSGPVAETFPAGPEVPTEDPIVMAEAAALAQPGDAAARARLGAAYLAGGRLDSAASAFAEALRLGDEDQRTVLGLAMALAGNGHADEAVALLEQHAANIGPENLGVALALAGRPAQGGRVLEEAIAAGGDSLRTRQDLAYAYTLAGRWREARALAELDLDPAEAHRRIARWLETSQQEAAALRVARYLEIRLAEADPGQPEWLAASLDSPAEPELLLVHEIAPEPESPTGSASRTAAQSVSLAEVDTAVSSIDHEAAAPTASVAFGTAVIERVELRPTGASGSAIMLSDLLSAVATGMESDTYASLSASANASRLVSLDELRASGFEVHIDPGA